MRRNELQRRGSLLHPLYHRVMRPAVSEPMTTFFGRAGEMATVAALLDRAPLVT